MYVLESHGSYEFLFPDGRLYDNWGCFNGGASLQRELIFVPKLRALCVFARAIFIRIQEFTSYALRSALCSLRLTVCVHLRLTVFQALAEFSKYDRGEPC